MRQLSKSDSDIMLKGTGDFLVLRDGRLASDLANEENVRIMPSSIHFEDAADRLRAFVGGNPAKQLQGANEAKTRLLVIDEVLAILGWSKSEYDPEHVTSTGGYTDYRLTIDGHPRLIVEAKRIGLVQALPRTIQRPEYTNSFLFNSCGSDLQSLLQQCRTYCTDCGVPYAVATTGDIWIILVGFKYGIEWGKLRSFVFHSLDDVSQRFGEFYGLISRESIKNNSLEERFGQMVLVKPGSAIRPRDHVFHPPDIGEVPDRHAIGAFFDQFMGDITRAGQEDMLEHCYVSNRKLNEFSRELQRLLEYDAALDEQDLTVEQVDEQKFEKALELQLESGNARTILLVGNVGAGKSTFVHRFISHVARPKRNVCAVVDLINEASIKTEGDRAEEQRLSKLALDKLAHEFRESLNPYDLDVMRGCFADEVGKFKRQRKVLFEQNPQEYMLKEEEHLWKISEDKYLYLIGYIRYARKKRYKTWLTFDNVDRGSATYQEFVYGFAQRLAVSAGCVTLITLREDTFLEAREAGFLDVRSSDTVFQITAPEFRQVVAKRRRFVDRLIESDRIPRQLKPYGRLVALLNQHISLLVLGNDDCIRLLITTFSLNNVRYGLTMLRDYYVSYYSTFHEFYQSHGDESECSEGLRLDYGYEHSRFIQALMLGNGRSYREETSKVCNVFAVEPSEQGSHFLMLRLLAYLSLDRNAPSSRTSVKYEKVSSDFVFLGYQQHHVNDAMRKLLYAGLVVSPNLPASPVTEAKVEVPDPLPKETKVALSAKGHYYLHTLASHEYYQTRVGEDTVWYDEELADLYIKCLQDSLGISDSTTSGGPSDFLQATSARETFLQYLRRSLLEETQRGNVRYTSKAWARVINDMVERSVFGEPLTQSIYTTEGNGTLDHERTAESRRALRTPTPLQAVRRQHGSPGQPNQMSLFVTDSANYWDAIQEAIKSLGKMPSDLKLQKSRYVVRVLWALEVAFRAGLGSLRASEIATIIRDYGKQPVADPNVAKFFRNQRHNGEYTHLWKEESEGQYTINTVGQSVLNSILRTSRRN